MDTPVENDEELRELLDPERIAVLGCSSTPGTAAHGEPESRTGVARSGIVG